MASVGPRVCYSVPFSVGHRSPSSVSVMMWMYNSDHSDSDNFGDESETSLVICCHRPNVRVTVYRYVIVSTL